MESIYKINEIDKAAQQFISYIQTLKIIAFHGDLGAGKTTFIKAVCKNLGVTENVSSPTFSIINQYKTTENIIIFHIDLYRVKDDDEAINAGVEECVYSNNICFIEWPEKIFFLPADTVNVTINSINTNTRKLTVKLP